MAPKSHIFVSIAEPAPSDEPEHYRKARYVWMLSLEPHEHHLPHLPRGKQVPTHHYAWRSKSGSYGLKTQSAGGDLIGNILIADSHVNGDEFHGLLQDKLASVDVALREDEEEGAIVGSDEEWIRHALRVLQAHGIIPTFDVEEFVMFAHGYVAYREDGAGNAPSMIAYPALHKDAERKEKKEGHWISYPHVPGMKKAEINGGSR